MLPHKRPEDRVVEYALPLAPAGLFFAQDLGFPQELFLDLTLHLHAVEVFLHGSMTSFGE
jgi:hypothetical protein